MTTQTLDQPTIATPAPADGAGDMFARATCYMVELRRYGTKRKVRAGSVTDEALDAGAVDMLHVSKDLLRSPELDAIERFDGETRRYLQTRCLPSLFKAGVYLLPNTLIDEVDAYVEARIPERAALVDRFVYAYESRMLEAETRLGPRLFRRSEYLAESQVRASFGMRTQYFAFGTPSTLSRAMFERERDKAAAQWTEALDECRAVLRAEMLELVAHMVDRLAPDADGKPRIFRDTLITNLDGFLSLFSARNIADDDALRAVVDDARKVLAGVTPDALRKDRSTREDVRDRMTAVKAAIESMPRPSRAFSDEE